MKSGYLTKTEAAEYMRVSIATLDRLMLQGLPYVKLERRVIFRIQDIDRWLEKRVIGKTRP